MAVLTAVKEFGHSFTKQFGAPKGKVESFIEVPFETTDGSTAIPDGLVRVSRGGRSWVALIEVKTGRSKLGTEQVETYLDVARDNGFDCVITISNQIPRIPGEHPVSVSRTKLRKVDLHHISWSRVLTEAVMQKSFRGVADPDQAWILGELIRYLEHPNAGSLDFDDMGEHWVAVRDAATHGTLRPTDKKAPEIASAWEELVTFIALRLGRELGANVQEVLSRKELADPSLRIGKVVQQMCDEGVLEGTIRIPGTVGDIRFCANLKAQQITADVACNAPSEGRPKTRINWLLKQLKGAPEQVRIDCYGARTRRSMSELLGSARHKPELLLPVDGKEVGSFVVGITRPMGVKRAGTKGSFVSTVVATVDEFYREVVQNLSAWKAAAPKFADSEETEEEIGREAGETGEAQREEGVQERKDSVQSES